MGKSSACRMVLEMVIDLRLSDAELVVIGPEVKGLLRMRAVYEPDFGNPFPIIFFGICNSFLRR